MEFEYRNREPLNDETEDFAREVAEDLDIDADRIIIYPSETAGIYAGREDEKYPVIGLDRPIDHVIVHELGHDRHAQVENRLWEAEPKTTSDGELTTRTLYEDDIASITDEIYAELVSEEYTLIGFERSPLRHAKQKIRKFTDNISLVQYQDFDVLEENHTGGKYLKDPEDPHEIKETAERIGDFLEQDEESFEDVLWNTWSKRIHKCVKRGEEDKIWNGINEFLDIPYGDHKWTQISSHYDEKVRETIENKTAHIGLEITKNLTQELVKISIDEGPIEQRFDDSLPNPSHFSPKVASEDSVKGFKNDFSHEVGNYAGRILHRNLGVTHEQLEEIGRDAVEEFAYHLLELSVEIGKNAEHYTKRDFDKGIEYLADQHLVED